MNYIFDGAQFVENIKKIANETIIKQICNRLAGLNEEYGSVRVWQNKFTDWKNGKVKPYADDLLRIASVYGCSVDDLLGISPREKTTTYSLLSVVDALVSSENAKIEMGEDDTTTYEDFQMILNYEAPREYVKVCSVKIYNNQLIDLLENYRQVNSMSTENSLRSKMCAAFIESEKENSTPLVSFSPDDKTFIYKAPDGGQLKFE